MNRGAQHRGARRFIRGAVMVSQCRGLCNYAHSSTRTIGPWRNVTTRYLGLKFKINGKFHYGWARLSVKALKGQFLRSPPFSPVCLRALSSVRRSRLTRPTNGPDDPEPVPSLNLLTPVAATLGAFATGVFRTVDLATRRVWWRTRSGEIDSHENIVGDKSPSHSKPLDNR